MPATLAVLARAALVTAALSLVLTGCGRRGALQPPPEAGAPRAQTSGIDAEDDEDGVSIAPTPAPGARKRPRNFTIPNRPFVLDPLL